MSTTSTRTDYAGVTRDGYNLLGKIQPLKVLSLDPLYGADTTIRPLQPVIYSLEHASSERWVGRDWFWDKAKNPGLGACVMAIVGGGFSGFLSGVGKVAAHVCLAFTGVAYAPLYLAEKGKKIIYPTRWQYYLYCASKWKRSMSFNRLWNKMLAFVDQAGLPTTSFVQRRLKAERAAAIEEWKVKSSRGGFAYRSQYNPQFYDLKPMDDPINPNLITTRVATFFRNFPLRFRLFRMIREYKTEHKIPRDMPVKWPELKMILRNWLGSSPSTKLARRIIPMSTVYIARQIPTGVYRGPWIVGILYFNVYVWGRIATLPSRDSKFRQRRGLFLLLSLITGYYSWFVWDGVYRWKDIFRRLRSIRLRYVPGLILSFTALALALDAGIASFDENTTFEWLVDKSDDDLNKKLMSMSIEEREMVAEKLEQLEKEWAEKDKQLNKIASEYWKDKTLSEYYANAPLPDGSQPPPFAPDCFTYISRIVMRKRMKKGDFWNSLEEFQEEASTKKTDSRDEAAMRERQFRESLTPDIWLNLQYSEKEKKKREEREKTEREEREKAAANSDSPKEDH